MPYRKNNIFKIYEENLKILEKYKNTQIYKENQWLKYTDCQWMNTNGFQTFKKEYMKEKNINEIF